MPLATCLYEVARNNLVHNGALPANLEFVKSEPGRVSFEVLDDRLRISHSFTNQVGMTVMFAPENGDLWPDIAETPPEVIAWMLFRKRRDGMTDYMEQRAERVSRIKEPR